MKTKNWIAAAGALLGLSLFLGATTEAFCAPKTSSEDDVLASEISRALPENVRKIQPGKTTRKQVIALLGNPEKDSSADHAYYRADGGRLTVGYRKNVVSYIYVLLAAGPGHPSSSLSKLQPLIPEKALKQAFAGEEKSPPSHEKGRELEILLPESALKLTFRQSEDPLLKSVLIWKKGDKVP